MQQGNGISWLESPSQSGPGVRDAWSVSEARLLTDSSRSLPSGLAEAASEGVVVVACSGEHADRSRAAEEWKLPGVSDGAHRSIAVRETHRGARDHAGAIEVVDAGRP